MASKPTVLIIDDEKNTREGLQKAFEDKYEIYVAESGEQGMNTLNRVPVDVVLTDLRMPGGMDGMDFIRSITASEDAPLVILFTAYGTVQTAVEAMKEGAYDYLTKPLNLENLEMVIDRGLETRQLRADNERLRQELDDKYGLEGIVGKSKAMQHVFESVRQVAPARTTVLLSGESGTGKELIAHALHNLSPRANREMVVVHCASLNPNLLESELFGHEKGAFTGAHEMKKGRFERAKSSTLFLDEIGEVDIYTQIKLLRVLETRTFERVGGTQTIETDVRLLAATNRNLWEQVENGSFREDLYYRLNVVEIRMPALRERHEDIPLLLDHFLKQACEENNKTRTGFSDEAIKLLTAYTWPGNVRELRNCVERMVVMSRGKTLTLGDVPDDIRMKVANEFGSEEEGSEEPEQNTSSGSGGQREEPGLTSTLNLEDHSKHMIIKALEECNGNRTQAAKKLGISRRTMYRKMKAYGLEDM